MKTRRNQQIELNEMAKTIKVSSVFSNEVLLIRHIICDKRKVQRGPDEEIQGIPQVIETGINICKQIDQEVTQTKK